MIKTIEKPYRKTTSDWIVAVENGEEKPEKITVEYYPLTVKELKQRQTDLARQKEENPEAVIWISDLLLPRLKALPDLYDPTGEKQIELTLDWLEAQDIRNLKNIQEAIERDESPKSKVPDNA